MSDIVVALIGAVAAITCVALPIYRSHDKKLNQIGEQVANSHTTNLRGDIDVITHKVDLVIDAMSVFNLDMAWLRREAADVVQRVERLEKKESA